MARTRRASGDFVPKAVTEDMCAAYTGVWCSSGRRAFLQALAGLGAPLDPSGLPAPGESPPAPGAAAKQSALESAVDAYRAARFAPASVAGDRDPGTAAYGAAELALRDALRPLHEDVVQQIAAHDPRGEGVKFVVGLRADALRELRRRPCPALSYLEGTLAGVLRGWFSSGFLRLERVTWQSPGALLEKIGAYEKVHPTRRFTDLKERLGPGRRCFAFEHPSMPQEPLVFVHVALVPEMAATLEDIRRAGRAGEGVAGAEEGRAGAAMFWSISATQPGLAGVDLGAFLIKRVVDQLRKEWPSLEGADPHAGLPAGFVFSTLSPVPGFVPWLTGSLKNALSGDAADGGHSKFAGGGAPPGGAGDGGAGDGEPLLQPSEARDLEAALGAAPGGAAAALLEAVSAPDGAAFRAATSAARGGRPRRGASDGGAEDGSVGRSAEAVLERTLTRLCARYLLREKRRGRALCPVANFHIRNGAVLERINWGADVSTRGLAQSCSLMVNYRYWLPFLEENHQAYVSRGHISRSDAVDGLLRG
jgi:malonyl-CoA decarboxylase